MQVYADLRMRLFLSGMTHPLDADSTPPSGHTLISVRDSNSRKASSPFSSRSAGMRIPDMFSVSASRSRKVTSSSLDTSLPSVDLPLPIKPIRAIDLC